MIDTLPPPVTGLQAWTANSHGGVEGLRRRFGPEQVAALVAAARATEGTASADVTREAFAEAPIAELMEAVAADLAYGRGAVVLTGLDLDAIGEEAFARIHFGLGAHLGRAMPQSARGDRHGVVQQEHSPELRGYQLDIELGPHTDFHELLSLASVAKADEGGLSGFVSSATIYNILREEQPELVAPWMEGYFYPTSADSVTDYRVPSLSLDDGAANLYNYRLFPFDAARIRGERVPETLVAAMRAADRIAARPEVRVSFLMQPGEMVFWHNFRVQHARTSFKNGGGRQRKLFRLWLRAHAPQPMARGFHEMAELLDRYHGEGRSLLVNTPESMAAVREAMAG